LLADHPNLVHERAIEPDFLEQGYFSNPRLLWFVAFNPTLAKTMPANILEITQFILDAGAAPDDISYTLELVLTSDPAQQQGFQAPLAELLLARGATVKPAMIYTILGHGQRSQIELLLRHGQPLTAPIAAGLGRTDTLASLLADADAETRHAALSMAVINNQVEAARLCLAAGADVNARVVVHKHATPLHQAAGNGQVEMTRLLLAHGADRSIKDTLWHGTPYGWAVHGKQAATAALLFTPGD
jgi:peptide-methionine (S)-S-oxide reductase